MSTVRTHASLNPVATEGKLIARRVTLADPFLVAAPSAIGPYSQAVKAGDLVFVSGCIPLVPSTAQIVDGGIVPQTEQALANLKAVLEASGSDVGRVVKTTVRIRYDDDAHYLTVTIGLFKGHEPLCYRQWHLCQLFWRPQACPFRRRGVAPPQGRSL